MTLYSDFTRTPVRLFKRFQSYKVACGFPAAHLISKITCLDNQYMKVCVNFVR